MNVGRCSLRLAVSFVVYPTFPDRKQIWISFEELAVSYSQSTFLNPLCQFWLQNQRTRWYFIPMRFHAFAEVLPQAPPTAAQDTCTKRLRQTLSSGRDFWITCFHELLAISVSSNAAHDDLSCFSVLPCVARQQNIPYFPRSPRPLGRCFCDTRCAKSDRNKGQNKQRQKPRQYGLLPR